VGRKGAIGRYCPLEALETQACQEGVEKGKGIDEDRSGRGWLVRQKRENFARLSTSLQGDAWEVLLGEKKRYIRREVGFLTRDLHREARAAEHGRSSLRDSKRTQKRVVKGVRRNCDAERWRPSLTRRCP